MTRKRRTVDSTELDESTSSSDTSCLLLVGGFVVVGHGLRLALIAKNRPRVTRIGLWLVATL